MSSGLYRSTKLKGALVLVGCFGPIRSRLDHRVGRRLRRGPPSTPSPATSARPSRGGLQLLELDRAVAPFFCLTARKQLPE